GAGQAAAAGRLQRLDAAQAGGQLDLAIADPGRAGGEAGREVDDGAPQTGVRDERVGAAAQDPNRKTLLLEELQTREEVVDAGGLEPQVGGAAQADAAARSQRLVLADAAAGHRAEALRHGAGRAGPLCPAAHGAPRFPSSATSSGPSLVMSPAPRVRT